MKDFRTLNFSIVQYQTIKQLKLRGEVRCQIERAALSVCLNLTEGNARSTQKDRKRMFNIAYASQQEVKTILVILNERTIFEKCRRNWSNDLQASTFQLAESQDYTEY